MESSPFFTHHIDQKLGTINNPSFYYVTAGDGSPLTTTTGSIMISRPNGANAAGLRLYVNDYTVGGTMPTIQCDTYLDGATSTLYTVTGPPSTALLTYLKSAQYDETTTFNKIATFSAPSGNALYVTTLSQFDGTVTLPDTSTLTTAKSILKVTDITGILTSSAAATFNGGVTFETTPVALNTPMTVASPGYIQSQTPVRLGTSTNIIYLSGTLNDFSILKGDGSVMQRYLYTSGTTTYTNTTGNPSVSPTGGILNVDDLGTSVNSSRAYTRSILLDGDYIRSYESIGPIASALSNRLIEFKRDIVGATGSSILSFCPNIIYDDPATPVNYMAFDVDNDGGQIESEGLILAPVTDAQAQSKISFLATGTTGMTDTGIDKHPSYGGEVVFSTVSRAYGANTLVREGLTVATIDSSAVHKPHLHFRSAGGIDVFENLYLIDTTAGTDYNITYNIDFAKYDSTTFEYGMQIKYNTLGTESGGDYSVLPGMTTLLGRSEEFQLQTSSLGFNRNEVGYKHVANIGNDIIKFKTYNIPQYGYALGYEKNTEYVGVYYVDGDATGGGAASSPALLNTYTLGGGTIDTVYASASGTKVYISRSESGWLGIDVSDPLNPVQFAGGDPGTINALTINGNYLYAAAADLGLLTYDITNPTTFTETPINTDDQGGIYDEIILDLPHNRLLVCAGAKLYIYDVSTASTPTYKGYIQAANTLRDVTVEGELLYAAEGDNDWEIYDITGLIYPGSPGQIFPTNTYTIPRNPSIGTYIHIRTHTIGTPTKYAFIGTNEDGIHIYDVTDPANVTAVANHDPGGYTKHCIVLLEGTTYYLWAAIGGGGLAIYNISNLPTFESPDVTDVGNVQWFAVSGTKIYGGGGGPDQLYIWDIGANVSTANMRMYITPGLTFTSDVVFNSTIASFIELGTTDAFTRFQIWNYGTDSILRMGGLGADGDPSEKHKTSEGIVVYGKNAQGDVYDYASSNNFAYTRIKPLRFGIYNSKIGVAAGYIWRVDDTQMYFKTLDQTTTTFSIQRASGNTIIGGTLAVDTIDEHTLDAGVTIETVLIKDGLVDGRDVSADGANLDNLYTTIGLGSLTAAEVDQLENIDTTTISAAQWGYVGALDQGLATTNNVTFNAVTATTSISTDTINEKTLDAGVTVDTVLIKDGLVDGRDVSTDGTNLDTLYTTIGLSALTAAEVDQLENIGVTTVSAAQWGYLGALDQGLATTNNVTFNTVTATTSISTDTLNEKTLDAGVTVDTVLIKDGLVDGRDVSVDGATLDNLNSTIGLNALTAAEVDQLENINTTTISAAQWGYLGALDQGLTTTSDVTFNTVTATTSMSTDTFNEYTLDAGVTIDTVLIKDGLVDGRDVSVDGGNLDNLYTTIGLSALTTAEVDQLENINTTTISSVQWGYLGALNQGLTTASDVTFNTVTLSTSPTNSNHAVTKAYADGIAAGIRTKGSVLAKTIAAIPAYTAAGSGVGKTITFTTAGDLNNEVGVSIDGGVTIVQGSRLLLDDSAFGGSHIDSGLYEVTTLGDAVTQAVLTRTTDCDGSPSNEVVSGIVVLITGGTTWANTRFVLTTSDPITVDTTALSWTQYSSDVFTTSAGITNVGVDIRLDLTYAAVWTGLHSFAHASGILTDVITEYTTDAGVTIETVLIKDGLVDGRDVSTDGSNLDNLYTTIGLSALTAAEVDQLENIGATTISATQWGYVGALNQNLTTASAVSFASISGLSTITASGLASLGGVITTANTDLTSNANVGMYFLSGGWMTSLFAGFSTFGGVFKGRDAGQTVIQISPNDGNDSLMVVTNEDYSVDPQGVPDKILLKLPTAGTALLYRDLRILRDGDNANASLTISTDGATYDALIAYKVGATGATQTRWITQTIDTGEFRFDRYNSSGVFQETSWNLSATDGQLIGGGVNAWTATTLTAGTGMSSLTTTTCRRSITNKVVHLMFDFDFACNATGATVTFTATTGLGVASGAVTATQLIWADDGSSMSPTRVEIAANQTSPITITLRGNFTSGSNYDIKGEIFYEAA